MATSIVDYTSLQTAVGTWLARSDLSANIPDFIALVETVANRRIRSRQMETSTTLTPSAGSATLPSDYLQWRRVTWTGSTRRELEYVNPSYLQAAFPSGTQDTPRMFTIEGSTLKVRPLDTTGLEFDYWQKITPLSGSATTNWLITAYPDLYLFGAMAEARMFERNLDNALVWKQRRDEVFDEILALDQKTRGASAIRVMGWTP